MKERPILFSAPMVRAILEGRKTQTRRVVKLPFSEPVGDWYPDLYRGEKPYTQWTFWERQDGRDTGRICNPLFTCPYGIPGEQLWVRETWNALYPVQGDMPWYHHELPEGQRTPPAMPIYRATKNDPNYPTPDDIEACFKWQPSIYMPRWASRISLEITDIRVERLLAISEADAQSEGVQAVHPVNWTMGEEAEASYTEAFRRLWQEINGQDSWDANPWVWVVEFKRVEGGAA